MRKTIAAALALPAVYAHCPLCTIGAAAAAGGAAYFGVNQAAIGVFIGAFAVSTGWWVSRMLKEYVPRQRELLIGLSFLLTIIPIMAILTDFTPIYVSLIGQYGGLLNRTYLLNLFLVGSIVGGAVVCMAPWVSERVTQLRGRRIPYQGVTLTFLLLFMTAGVLQGVL